MNTAATTTMNHASVLSRLLALMTSRAATDLFLTAHFPPCMRLDGDIKLLGESRLSLADVQAFLQILTSASQRESFERSLELNFAYQSEQSGRFRINVMRQRGLPAITLRRIPSVIPTMEQLNLPDSLKSLVLQERGLILVVGSADSGKSTTLASLIDYRNRQSKGHIITVEDPVEFIHEHQRSIVHQREVGGDTHSWHDALVNALRQSPDVILIGEVRDRETMEYALSFAETGHLVLATLHANNANQALDRVMNFFPDEVQKQTLLSLSFNLRAVVSQRLVPLKSGQGRVAALELLLHSPYIADLIAKGEIGRIREAMEKNQMDGMQTFDQALLELHQAGKIDESTAIRFAESANNVRLALQLGTR